MSGLTLLLLVSVLIRSAALIWSVALVWRYRDWRMGTLTALLVLGVFRQMPALVSHLGSGHQVALNEHELAGEIPALLVSILALAFVSVLDRSITKQMAENERLRRADPLYDLVILTDWNWPSAERGRGSAIFMHRWRRGGKCPRDSSPLERATSGGRTTAWCPKCQRE